MVVEGRSLAGLRGAPTYTDGPMDATNPAHAGAPMPVPVHYDLHVWLYRENPDGMLAAFNPDVSCRPDAPTADPSPERVTPI